MTPAPTPPPTPPASGVPPAPPPDARAGYPEAVRAEWTKFRTVRSSVLLTLALAAALPTLAALVAATGSLQPDDTILGASLLGGAVLAQCLAVALGALLVTNEVRTGMIRTTLAACPRRRVVLGAKATVAAGAVAAVTLPAALAAHGIGLLLLDGDRYATGQPWPAVGGVALAIASLAVLGVALGTVVRHSAGAVAAGIGVVLLPGLVAPLLGDARRWLGGASLDGVLQKLTQSSDATPETVGSLGAWPSLAVLVAWTVVATAAAGWLLHHRDT